MIFDLSIEQTAALLDASDVGKHLAYDRAHVEAIAKARRERRKDGPVEMPVSGQPLVLEPEYLS